VRTGEIMSVLVARPHEFNVKALAFIRAAAIAR
jgi:hypothetical protein